MKFFMGIISHICSSTGYLYQKISILVIMYILLHLCVLIIGGFDRRLMNRKIVNQVLGSYEPSLFKLQYNIDKPLCAILNTPSESIFMHEYIHFLQDIACIFGNLNLQQ